MNTNPKTLALLFLTCTGAKASAQNDTTAAQTAAVTGAPKAWFSFLTEIRMGSDILDYPKFMTYDWNIAPGVSFRNGLSLRIPVEAVFGMTKESYNDYDGYYSSNGTLGLNLGYDFLNKNDRMRLELNASGGSTYLKTPYRFAYADLNLKFGSKHLGAYNMYVGLGLRYLSPYNPDMTVLHRTLLRRHPSEVSAGSGRPGCLPFCPWRRRRRRCSIGAG